MSQRPPHPHRRPITWAGARDAGAFMLGAFMLTYETLTGGERELILIIGLAALGVTGSGLAQRFIEARLPPASPPQEGPPSP